MAAPCALPTMTLANITCKGGHSTNQGDRTGNELAVCDDLSEQNAISGKPPGEQNQLKIAAKAARRGDRTTSPRPDKQRHTPASLHALSHFP